MASLRTVKDLVAHFARQNQLVLIPLLVVLLGGGAYVTKPWSSDEPAPARQQAPATGAAAQGATGPVADVRLDLLTATGGDAATIMRNPFRFQPRAVPAATTVRRAAPRPEFTAPTSRPHSILAHCLHNHQHEKGLTRTAGFSPIFLSKIFITAVLF